MGPLWTIGKELNDVNSFMDLERTLRKKCNRIPMVVAQRLISCVRRYGAGAYGV